MESKIPERVTSNNTCPFRFVPKVFLIENRNVNVYTLSISVWDVFTFYCMLDVSYKITLWVSWKRCEVTYFLCCISVWGTAWMAVAVWLSLFIFHVMTWRCICANLTPNSFPPTDASSCLALFSWKKLTGRYLFGFAFFFSLGNSAFHEPCCSFSLLSHIHWATSIDFFGTMKPQIVITNRTFISYKKGIQVVLRRPLMVVVKHQVYGSLCQE